MPNAERGLNSGLSIRHYFVNRASSFVIAEPLT